MEVGDAVENSNKEEQRLLSVLALLKGEAAAQVCQQYNICRSDLYKFRRRALAAMRSAVKDQRRGPRRPPIGYPKKKSSTSKLSPSAARP
jgi:transposase-like protein